MAQLWRFPHPFSVRFPTLQETRARFEQTPGILAALLGAAARQAAPEAGAAGPAAAAAAAGCGDSVGAPTPPLDDTRPSSQDPAPAAAAAAAGASQPAAGPTAALAAIDAMAAQHAQQEAAAAAAAKAARSFPWQKKSEAHGSLKALAVSAAFFAASQLAAISCSRQGQLVLGGQASLHGITLRACGLPPSLQLTPTCPLGCTPNLLSAEGGPGHGERVH